MLRWLGLPFFLMRLGLVILPSVIALGWSTTSKHRALLLASTLLFLTLLFSTVQTLSLRSVTPPPNPLVAAEQLLNSLSDRQPTHRDVLINLSRIYQAIGNEEKAQQYLDQAQKLDPNNPLFAQEK